MSNFRPLTLLLALIVFTLTGLFVSTGAARELPFSAGEKFVYKAKWGFVDAGEAVIETLPYESINGKKVLHFAMTTNTSETVDRIYKSKQRQDSYVDSNFTHSVQYQKRSMGSHPREVVVYFDWKLHQAVYVNFGEPERPVSLVPGTFDPLSMFFVIRMGELKEGKVIEIPITDGKKFIAVKALVSGRERITVNDREYDTYVVVPNFDLSKAFDKNQPDLKIWFTADKKRIPVKIQSKMKIGTFDLELVSSHL
jgi:hypothetical protein